MFLSARTIEGQTIERPTIAAPAIEVFPQRAVVDVRFLQAI